MKRIVSVWLPYLTTDRLRLGTAGAPPDDGAGLAVTREEHGRRVLVALDPVAEAAGLHVGLPLADARAMVPALRAMPADPAADARLLAELADWCTRYTPWTAVEGGGPGGPGGGLWLDISGCAHLFGGEAALLSDLAAGLARRGVTARLAVAPTPGGAWALARFDPRAAEGLSVGDRETLIAALAGFPAAALRLDGATVAALRRVGLRRVSEVAAIPRAALARRFGETVPCRIDQAHGRLEEPISPQRPPVTRRACLSFAEPILTPEAIAEAIRRCLVRLVEGLERERLGARRLELALYRVDGLVRRAAIGTSRPTRDAAALMRLFAEHLDRVDPGFGLEALAIAAVRAEPLEPAQRSLVPERMADGSGTVEPGGVAALVDRLSARVGPARVLRLTRGASHWPERAGGARPILVDTPETESRATPPRDQTREPAGEGRSGALGAPRDGVIESAAGRLRPLRLLTRPERLQAVSLLPDRAPAMFRWGKRLLRVRAAEGPERIAPEWWGVDDPAEALADTGAREYYRVEDLEGGRYWIYREAARDAGGGRWYLHGLFG